MSRSYICVTTRIFLVQSVPATRQIHEHDARIQTRHSVVRNFIRPGSVVKEARRHGRYRFICEFPRIPSTIHECPAERWCPCPGRLAPCNSEEGCRAERVEASARPGTKIHPRSARRICHGPVHKSEVLKKDRAPGLVVVNHVHELSRSVPGCLRSESLLCNCSCPCPCQIWLRFGEYLEEITMDLSNTTIWSIWRLKSRATIWFARTRAPAQVQTRRQQPSPCLRTKCRRPTRVTIWRESFLRLRYRRESEKTSELCPDSWLAQCLVQCQAGITTYKQAFIIRTKNQENW